MTQLDQIIWGLCIFITWGPVLLAYALYLSRIEDNKSKEFDLNEKAFIVWTGHETDLLTFEERVQKYRLYLLSGQPYCGLSASSEHKGCLSGGMKDDFVRFVMNEHSLLGIFLSDLKHPYGRVAKAYAYITVQSLSLMLYSVFSIGNDPAMEYFLSFALLPVLGLIAHIIFRTLLTCFCCSRFNKKVWDCCTYTSQILFGLLSLLSFFWITLTVVIFSGYPDKGYALKKLSEYFYSVFIISTVFEIFLSYRYFIDISPHCGCCIVNLFYFPRQSWIYGKKMRETVLSEHIIFSEPISIENGFNDIVPGSTLYIATATKINSTEQLL